MGPTRLARFAVSKDGVSTNFQVQRLNLQFQISWWQSNPIRDRWFKGAVNTSLPKA